MESIMSIVDFKSTYSVAITIVAILSIVYSLYNRIKFLCLEKAIEFVSAVEERENLKGKEKFSLVLYWLNKDLPGIFRNSLLRTVLEKIIQYAYEKCYLYMKNRIKRVTGLDMDELMKELNLKNKK